MHLPYFTERLQDIQRLTFLDTPEWDDVDRRVEGVSVLVEYADLLRRLVSAPLERTAADLNKLKLLLGRLYRLSEGFLMQDFYLRGLGLIEELLLLAEIGEEEITLI